MRWQPRIEYITIRQDTREQCPWRPEEIGMRTVVATLRIGDYALHAVPGGARIERKSLVDLVQCVGRERERFEREITALLGFPRKLLVVESDWASIERGGWPGKVTPASVIGSLLKWQSIGLPILLAGTRRRAAKLAGQFLFQVARDLWRDARGLVLESDEAAEVVA